MNISLKELITAVQGEFAGDLNECLFKGVSIDSRRIKTGEIFFAIKGDRFDGHDYIADALGKGASGAVLREIPEAVQSSHLKRKPLIVVADTITALGDLASFWRKKQAKETIAISGSCGKTTTKEMLASILSLSMDVLKTEGNFNNHIGLPLTMLRMSENHDVGVFEVGVSQRGEMRRLGEILSPDMALLTNIGEAHLADLKNVNVVAGEKMELFRSLKKEGTMIINMDDPLIASMAGELKRRRITYGTDKNADVVLKSYVLNEDNGSHAEPVKGTEFLVSVRGRECKGRLNAIGKPNLLNALSAIAAATALNIECEQIMEGLRRFVPLKGRMQIISLNNGIKMIDDTYNANPSSVEHSLKTLLQVKCKGKRLAVLGDMLDLGDETARAHREIGKLVSALEVDHLFLVGKYGAELAKSAIEGGMDLNRVKVVGKKEDVVSELMDVLEEKDCILVKGSRGMKMEDIVESLKENLGVSREVGEVA